MRRSLLTAALWGGLSSVAAAQTADPDPNAYIRASDLYDAILGAGDMDGLLGRHDPAPSQAAPDALVSQAPAHIAPSRVPEIAPAWLEGVALPDLPVRWHPRLVELLTACRDDPGTRSVARALHSRSNRFAPMIRRKLHDAGLPEDLLFVAMVESGFDPTVRSPAGALGLWQFVKTTGTDYGLTITPYLDERMHAERATDGAIAFLKDLRARLGSWDLALAAYNMGYGGVLRSIRKYNSNDFWRLTELEAGLPFETVNYVTKVVAYAVIGRNPELFGLANATRVPTEEVALVEVPPGMSLERLARGTGFDARLLATYNPHLVKGRVPADAVGWQIRVPANRRDELVERLVRMNAPPHRVYVMRFGEQLSDIATMFSTSVTALRRLNKLAPDEAIGVGFSLLVPDVEPKVPPAAEPPVVAIPDVETILTDRRQVFYRATGRESCDEVARFFGVTLDELRAWNHVDTSATLQPDMYLQLFVANELDLSRAVVLQATEVRPLILESEEFFAFHEGLRDRVRVLYRMRPGDTVDKVAERYDLSVGSIFRINQFGRERTLQVNDEIVLYVPTEAAARLTADTTVAHN